MTADTSTLAYERQQALRTLLRRPLLTVRNDREHFGLVLAHETWLRDVCSSFLGYRLVVQHGYARLYKTPLQDRTPRGASARSAAARRAGRAGTPLHRRDYVLAFLAAGALARHEQILLSHLVLEVQIAAADAGVRVNFAERTDRRALLTGLAWLAEVGAIEELDTRGDFVDDVDGAEALLEIDRDVLRALVANGVSRAGTVQEVLDGPPAPARHVVRRRVAETPIVYRADLDDDAVAFLRDEQRRDAELWRDRLGLELEIRIEGVALIDDDGVCTDEEFPGANRDSHGALWAADTLTHGVVAGSDGRLPAAVPIEDTALHDAVVALAATRPASTLGKAFAANPDEVVVGVRGAMQRFGLLTTDADGTDLLWAGAGRYRFEHATPRVPPLTLPLEEA